MRFYATLPEALSEISRDVSKSPKLTSTRVQQRVGEELVGRESLNYSYAIEAGGIPNTVHELIELGQGMNFKHFVESPEAMHLWLTNELEIRRFGVLNQLNEVNHPALAKTLEGNWSAYTYGERLHGALNAMAAALRASPDSRRAYWPIFRPEDSLRAGAPTRIPCSLGYQALIRPTLEEDQLILIYSQRSADFDTFFLTDIFLASRFQAALGQTLGVHLGQFMHNITSLHSFEVEGTEIY